MDQQAHTVIRPVLFDGVRRPTLCGPSQGVVPSRRGGPERGAKHRNGIVGRVEETTLPVLAARPASGNHVRELGVRP